MTTRILIADDHQMVLDGLKALIDLMPGFEVCGEAKNGWEVLDLLNSSELPDILIMDISMPEMDGLETMQRLADASSEVKVLIMSMHLSASYAKQLIGLGAKGYLQKDCDLSELKNALKDVREGGTYLSKNMTELLVNESGGSESEHELEKPRLSPREQEILSLLQREFSSREIGEELGISFHTVETHRKHLLNKFAVNSTIGLIREAMRCGLLD